MRRNVIYFYTESITGEIVLFKTSDIPGNLGIDESMNDIIDIFKSRDINKISKELTYLRKNIKINLQTAENLDNFYVCETIKSPYTDIYIVNLLDEFVEIDIPDTTNVNGYVDIFDPIKNTLAEHGEENLTLSPDSLINFNLDHRARFEYNMQFEFI